MVLIKSRQRVADHGEVFTPTWLVNDMLDQVAGETERVDSRVLEPACGSGNFLVQVLRRKLGAINHKYGKSDFERRHFALFALMSIYGIELLADNIVECRANLVDVFTDCIGDDASVDTTYAAYWVLSQNLVQGDALLMRTQAGDPICFAEWGYLGTGRYKRRDFRFETLTSSSLFSAEGSLFAHLGKHSLFTPTKDYPPMGISDLAVAGRDLMQQRQDP